MGLSGDIMTFIISSHNHSTVIITTEGQAIYIKGEGDIKEVIAQEIEILKSITKELKPSSLLTSINNICESKGWTLVAY